MHQLEQTDLVTDLTTIELGLDDSFPIVIGLIGFSYRYLSGLQHVIPNLLASILGQFWIVEIQGNSGLERLVNPFSTVGGEEEGSLVVIQQSEEDTYDGRPFEVGSHTL